MNIEDFKKLSETGVSLAIASRDREMRPDIADLSGFRLNPDLKSLVAFINSETSQRTLMNLRSFPQAAISMSRPCDFFAAQIKGKVTCIRKMTAEEEIISQNWADKYRQEMILVNSIPESVDALNFLADTALEVSIEDLFNQTPGVNAGARLVRR